MNKSTEITKKAFLCPWAGIYKKAEGMGAFQLIDKDGNAYDGDTKTIKCTVTFKVPKGYKISKYKFTGGTEVNGSTTD